MEKIILVTGVHGDEPHALAVGQRVEHPDVTVIIAKSAAIAAGKRYLETDLNRSFGAALPASLEENLAPDLKSRFKELEPSIVLDLHNTNAKGTTCAIITVDPLPRHLEIIAHLGFDKVVIMPPSGSLISSFNDSATVAISLEVANDDVSKFEPEVIAQKIAQIAAGGLDSSQAPQIFKHVGAIKKTTLKRVGIEARTLKNFSRLTKTHLALLGLASKLELYPIFKGGKHMREDAFTLVCRV
jgi:succinylglutamate desuccinylase